MQHGEFFQRHPPTTFIIVPILFIGQLIICRMFRLVRIHILRVTSVEIKQSLGRAENEVVCLEEYKDLLLMDPLRYGRAYAACKWDADLFEAEIDIASLSISFLTIQACRFNITGVLPDNLGIEEEDFKHPFDCTWKLGSLSLLFAMGTVLLVRISKAIMPKEHSHATIHALLKRGTAVIQNALSMSFAWGLLYSVKWQMARVPMCTNPNALHARVVLALLVSFVAFLVIACLDFLADLECTGSTTDMAIFSIISSLGILIGFAWEQSFDGGLEVIGELVKKPLVVQICLACMVAVVVVHPWRRYILPNVVNREKAWEARHSDPDSDTEMVALQRPTHKPLTLCCNSVERDIP